MRTDGGAGPLRVLGVRREAPDEGGDDGPTRPLKVKELKRRSWPFRLVLGVVKVVLAVIAVFLAGIALLYAFTPSAGQATSLAASPAAGQHIAYPGPSVPQNFAEALVATEDHRFYADPGVDPLALVRVAASW